MKALVVDDEQDIVDEVCAFLSRRGHDVVGAGGVDEACRHLDAEGTFDVVLTDMRMDPGTGLDVIRACNRLDKPRPTTLLLTGQASPEQIGEATKEGVARVLTKPVSLRALLDVLRQVGEKRVSSGA